MAGYYLHNEIASLLRGGGVRPNGMGWELDTDNPMTDGLLTYINGANNGMEFVQGLMPAQNTTTGEVVYKDGIEITQNSLFYDRQDPLFDWRSNGGFTVLCRFRRDSSDFEQLLQWGNTTNSGDYWSIECNDTYIRERNDGTAKLSYSTTVGNGTTWFNVAIRVGSTSSATDSALWVDGASRDTDNLFPSNCPARFGVGGRDTATPSGYNDASYDFIAIYDRAFSDDELRWYTGDVGYKDLQNLLRPASNAPLYLTTGATGAGTHTGTGALTSQDSSVSGTGVITRTGTGALTAQESSVSGTGEITRTGTGALAANDSSISGTGTVTSAGTHTGTGALTAQASAMAGTGVITRVGTGALAANDSSVSGAGVVLTTITGTGALVSQSATISGIGTAPITITGTGALIATNCAVNGTGGIVGWSMINEGSDVWTEVNEGSDTWTIV